MGLQHLDDGRAEPQQLDAKFDAISGKGGFRRLRERLAARSAYSIRAEK